MSIEWPARLIFGLCALSLVLGIAHLIRHGQLKEKYALLWVPLGAAFAVFGMFPEILVVFSNLVGLHYITVVVLCIILAFTLILLYFTTRLSQLREDVKTLAQEMALLKAEGEAHSPLPPSDGWIASPKKKAGAGSLDSGE